MVLSITLSISDRTHWRVKMVKVFIRHSQNVVCEMAAMLSRPQCVKALFILKFVVCYATSNHRHHDWSYAIVNTLHFQGKRRDKMMTSSNGNVFRVTCHLCGEFTGGRWIPKTKASDGELWCFFFICVRISALVILSVKSWPSLFNVVTPMLSCRWGLMYFQNDLLFFSDRLSSGILLI